MSLKNFALVGIGLLVGVLLVLVMGTPSKTRAVPQPKPTPVGWSLPDQQQYVQAAQKYTAAWFAGDKSTADAFSTRSRIAAGVVAPGTTVRRGVPVPLGTPLPDIRLLTQASAIIVLPDPDGRLLSVTVIRLGSTYLVNSVLPAEQGNTGGRK